MTGKQPPKHTVYVRVTPKIKARVIYQSLSEVANEAMGVALWEDQEDFSISGCLMGIYEKYFLPSWSRALNLTPSPKAYVKGPRIATYNYYGVAAIA